MGQYFRAVITTANMKKVESWFLCYDYGDGAKLTEHAYIGNDYVSAVESRLAEKPGHVVWAGDYGDLKLYDKCSTIKKVDPAKYPATERTGRFLINHSAKEFVDKEKVPAYDDGWKLHPLPLLTANGNGEGGGRLLRRRHIQPGRLVGRRPHRRRGRSARGVRRTGVRPGRGILTTLGGGSGPRRLNKGGNHEKICKYPGRTTYPERMEQDILEKIGNNKTNEKTFDNGVFIDEPSRNELLGFYTYKGEVCILDGLGMDVTFSSYSEKNQTVIHSAIMSGKYN